MQKALKDLNGENNKQRRAALDPLAQAIPALIATLQDKDWSIKIAAVRGRGELNSPQAVAALIGVLQGAD